MRLFPCRACAAKDSEIARQQEAVLWLREQIARQNKLLAEIADPRVNERVVQADRIAKRPIRPPARVDPAAGLRLPGTEPSPSPSWEVDDEAS